MIQQINMATTRPCLPASVGLPSSEWINISKRTRTAPPKRSEPKLAAVTGLLAVRFDAVSLMWIISTGRPSALLATYNDDPHSSVTAYGHTQQVWHSSIYVI